MADLSSSEHAYGVPCFTGENYDNWCIRMETYLSSRGLWDVVKDEPPSMEALGDRDRRRLQHKNDAALVIIQQSMPDSKFIFISEANTANGAWETLRVEFQRPQVPPDEPKDSEQRTKRHWKVYNAAKRGTWAELNREIGTNDANNIKTGTEITMFEENILHIIVSRGTDSTQILTELVGNAQFDVLLKKDSSGNTPLSRAAMIGNERAARIMVNRYYSLPPRAAADEQVTEGSTPATNGSPHGQVPQSICVEINGAAGNESSLDGASSSSASLNASTSGDIVPGSSSAATNASPRQVPPCLLLTENSDGLCPAHIAAMNGHKEMTRYLITEMLRLNKLYYLQGEKGVRLLNLLITASFYGLATLLLDRHSPLAYGKDSSSMSPIHTFAKDPLGENRKGAVILIRRICHAMHNHHLKTPSTNNNGLSNDLWIPIVRATKLGTHEIVEEIIDTCPSMSWLSDEHERTIYHLAVQYRHEKIFNLIWNLGADKYRVLQLVSSIDKSNILHLAASTKLSPTTYTNRVAGAALQMQRELQWFETLKQLCPVYFQKAETIGDEKTPIMVFNDEHTELAKEGETWMKTTATAYSVVTALVITVLFTVTFQLPGGNSGNGLPNFRGDLFFKIFAIADTIGFVSSTTSLVVFLSILTSRYSGNDFLHSLPNKLIIGLLTLFVSIFCMMITFAAGLGLYSASHDRLFKAKNIFSANFLIPFLVIVAICSPGAVFIFLQFPLLRGIIYSTFGSSIISHPAQDHIKLKFWQTRNHAAPAIAAPATATPDTVAPATEASATAAPATEASATATAAPATAAPATVAPATTAFNPESSNASTPSSSKHDQRIRPNV